VGYKDPKNGFLAQDAKENVKLMELFTSINDISDFIRQMILLSFIKTSQLSLL